MRKIWSYAIFFLLILMAGCGINNNTTSHEVINATLICPDGLPSIAISKSIDEDKQIGYIGLNYSIQNTPDLLLAELMKGQAELAIVPSNLALQAYRKNLGYKVAATIGWGSLYLVSTEDISDISQLDRCEIYNTGKGLTPDIILKNILSKNNLMDKNIEFSYVGAASELTPMLISGKVKYAVLPEPALSTVMDKNKKIKIISNLNEEWSRINNVKRGYPQSTLLIKEEFYNKIKDTGLYDEIIQKFNDSEDWAVNNPQLVVEKCEKLGITVNKSVIESSMKNSNLKFTKIEECMKEYKTYFSIIDKESTGEKDEYESIFIKKQ